MHKSGQEGFIRGPEGILIIPPPTVNPSELLGRGGREGRTRSEHRDLPTGFLSLT